MSWGVLGYPGVSWGNQTDRFLYDGWKGFVNKGRNFILSLLPCNFVFR